MGKSIKLGDLCAVKLSIFVLLTAIISLSIHVVALALGVPYPKSSVFNLFLVGVLVNLTRIVGFFTLYYLARHKLNQIPLWQRLILLSMLILAIQELLIRVPVMSMIVTKTFGFIIVTSLPKYIEAIILAIILVGFFAWTRKIFTPTINTNLKVVVFLGGIIFTLIVLFIINPLGNYIVGFLITYVNQPNPEQILQFPYSFTVNAIAYITYLVPVIASFIWFWLIADSAKNQLKQGLLYIILLLFIRGYLVLVIAAVIAEKSTVAFISIGQFILEIVSLGSLTVIFINRLCKN